MGGKGERGAERKIGCFEMPFLWLLRRRIWTAASRFIAFEPVVLPFPNSVWTDIYLLWCMLPELADTGEKRVDILNTVSPQYSYCTFLGIESAWLLCSSKAPVSLGWTVHFQTSLPHRYWNYLLYFYPRRPFNWRWRVELQFRHKYFAKKLTLTGWQNKLLVVHFRRKQRGGMQCYQARNCSKKDSAGQARASEEYGW